MGNEGEAKIAVKGSLFTSAMGCVAADASPRSKVLVNGRASLSCLSSARRVSKLPTAVAHHELLSTAKKLMHVELSGSQSTAAVSQDVGGCTSAVQSPYKRYIDKGRRPITALLRHLHDLHSCARLADHLLPGARLSRSCLHTVSVL